ncbi:MAG: hypothetical protein RMK01_04085 [Thermomicrobium sp.]|nr:hypothetical protein [Thermomicrobium sp.]
MSERRWKRVERRVARLLGAQRVPVDGRGQAPDLTHPWLAVEVKSRQRLPQWLRSAMAQAVRTARPEQLPLVVLHQVGHRWTEDLVLLRLADFRAWFVGEVEDDAE